MARPIKVAYILGGLPFGGVENWLFDLVQEFRKGIAVEPFVINISGTGDLMEKYSEAGIEVLTVGGEKSILKTQRLDTVFALRSLLKEINPDVVHTMHFSGDYFGRLASIGLGKPVFVHIHTGVTQRKGYRRLINRLLSFVTSCYLSVSQQVAKIVEQDHNWAGRNSLVLYNAVDSYKLDVAPLDFEEMHGLSGRTIIGVGRFVPLKNFDKLIKAFSILKKLVPDASLILLGDGGQMETLKDLVEKLGLNESVALPGFVKNEDVPKYLKAAHVLAMPSDYEGLPITHVEALFCGLPAVISEYVPSLEIASNASLVCRAEVDDITGKLLSVMTDSELHKKLSTAALDIAPNYSMGRYVETLVGLYRDYL